jgi:DNA-binding transcriptional ArsR family regulator
MPDDACDLLCLDLPRAEAVRAQLPDLEQLTADAARMRALADPTRLQVARALQAGGELCVCDLAWICSRAENLVSHHARALRTSGLANSRRDGKMVLYSLTPVGEHLLAAATTEVAR